MMWSRCGSDSTLKSGVITGDALKIGGTVVGLI